MRWTLATLLVAGCSSSATSLTLDEPPCGPENPTVREYGVLSGDWDVERDPLLGTVRSLSGEGVAMTPDQALAFVRARGDLWGTTEFVEDGRVVDATVTSIALVQKHHGVPVRGGHLGLVLARGRLVLAQGTTYRLDKVDPVPQLTATAASLAVDAVLPASPGDRDEAKLEIAGGRLVWAVTAWRGDDHQDVVDVDAHTGAVLGGYDENRFDYKGVAKNNVDERTVGDQVVQLPAAFLRLSATRGAVTTDGEGGFAIRGDGGVVMVTANLQGSYVTLANKGGDDAHFAGMMRPEKNYQLEWTEARSTPEERDVFRGVNVTNRFVATVFPDNAWLNAPLLAKVNLPHTCNAFWNGTSINFFVAGNGCNNSGRIFDVVAHEFGHGLDQNLPGMGIDGGLGEFIGDMISFTQTHSHLIGPGFLVDGGAVRDLEDPRFACYDTSIRGVHGKGQQLGEVIWDVMTDLEKVGFTGEPLKRLFLRPIAIAQTRAEWYRGMLAVDDNDGNLANGTPHECLIYKEFVAHSCSGERWPGIPDRAPKGCE